MSKKVVPVDLNRFKKMGVKVGKGYSTDEKRVEKEFNTVRKNVRKVLEHAD